MNTSDIEDLQTRLAYSEATIAQLDDALVAQQSRIDRLEARLEALALEVRENASSDDEADQPPPHY